MKNKRMNETLEIKAIEKGSISFYASVFDVVDSHKDLTHKGTFVNTIKRFNEGEISVDLRLEHKQNFKTVGAITEMEIDSYGLKCKASFTENPIGRKVNAICKNVFETKSQDILFSIGYITKKESNRMLEGKKVRSIDDIVLGEVSIVEKPSNKLAKVLEVKAEETEEEKLLREAREREESEAMEDEDEEKAIDEEEVPEGWTETEVEAEIEAEEAEPVIEANVAPEPTDAPSELLTDEGESEGSDDEKTKRLKLIILAILSV